MITRRKRGWLSSIVLSAIVAGSGSLAGPVSAAEFRFNPGAWLEAAMDANAAFPALGNVAQIVAGPSQVSYNGKLTVLLVGSDFRAGHSNGERLDSIMVVSVNPANDQISAASIPRDTARIPFPPQFGGGEYKGKINGIFKYFKKQGNTRNVALDKFKQVVEHVLDIKIDYVGFLRFNGFDKLVDEVGGVLTSIPNEIRDPKYIDKPGWPTGAKFEVHTSPKALLKGATAQRCFGGYPKPVTNWEPVMDCKRALVYVRSRKGSIVGCCGSSDYKRAARQQKFVFDAIQRVLSQGGSSTGNDLVDVMNANSTEIYTSLPTSSGDVTQLVNLLSGTTLAHTVVFSPSTYAAHIGGTSANRLKLDVVRAWCDQWFDDN
jgi:anionic cell wall polymer biosynthesis LytR-Cps2A-Psr (LCP) family protein